MRWIALRDRARVVPLIDIVVVSWQLGRSALVDPWTVGLAIASWVDLVWFRNNSAWLIGLGGTLGWLFG